MKNYLTFLSFWACCVEVRQTEGTMVPYALWVESDGSAWGCEVADGRGWDLLVEYEGSLSLLKVVVTYAGGRRELLGSVLVRDEAHPETMLPALQVIASMYPQYNWAWLAPVEAPDCA